MLGLAGTASWAQLTNSFTTSKPAELKALQSGVTIKPILTVGDKLSTGYQMAATPDGLGAFDNGNGTMTVLMNHELSRVDGENLTNSRVSRLVIDKKNLNVLSGQYLIKGTEGYHRLCSATLVGQRENFNSNLFLTNEEATDSKFGGISVAVNPQTGQRTNLPWIGHFSHENTHAIPGYNKIVIVSTEDSAPGFLWMYIAQNQADLLAGRGQLYVFKAKGGSTPADISKNKSLTGSFIPITQQENKNATTLRAAAEAKKAMVFVRLEDVAYSTNDPKTLYFAGTGNSDFLNPATNKPYNAKGRIHTIKLDPSDPTKVLSLRAILDGDAGDNILNPDNLATSDKSLMIQEDLNEEFRGKRTARVLRYDFRTKRIIPVAQLLQKDFKGKPIPNDIPGDWESSGIINMTNITGPDTWLLDVQAHTLKVNQFGGQDEGGQLLLMTIPNSATQLPVKQ
jgi:hypothetical protein